jgi:peptidoglycan/LPS O-acetylase OafA/YrhL
MTRRMSDSAAAVHSKKGVKAPHLYEVDVLRILTFLCVIAVHTISNTAAQTDVPLYGFLTLVHFTREVFFALTAFVLVYSYLNRPKPMRNFLPRRFLLVGVPYVAWSVIYEVARHIRTPNGSIGDLIVRTGGDILTGNAWYHLYFLLVTMQVYLLVPVILWLVRVTRKHPWVVLAVSFMLQLALTGAYMYFPAITNGFSDFQTQAFFSYQFFIISGAVAADHRDQFLPWVRSHRRIIGVIVAGCAVAILAVFGIQSAHGISLSRSSTPLQPIMMVWSVAVALGFLAIGTWYADRRKPGSVLAKALDAGSDRSFGVFLAHPLFIWLLLWMGDGWLAATVPRPWLTWVTYLLVIIGSLALTELARRSWLSMPLTGRKYLRRRSKTSRSEISRSENSRSKNSRT